MSLPASIPAPVAAIRRARQSGDRSVGAWLLACCAVLFALIVIGGITRLTHSGLSIVEWAPLIGTLPPLTEQQWLETFEKYRQTPEYTKVNQGMTLAAFKGIFWWEYVHRLIARVLGLAFFVPFVWFLVRRRVDRQLAWKLAGIFVLGALQGGMGWYMVKSGLVDNPRVSHLRLTAHLGIAFAIFAAMFWQALSLLRPAAPTRAEPARAGGPAGLAGAIALLVFVQVLSGGLVAGIRAGFAYNTFPLMAGEVMPPGILMLEPWTLNFLYNVATIQFTHRTIAWVLLALALALWWRARGQARAGTLPAAGRAAASLLLVAIALQFALGVATLVAMVPVPLGAAHQGGAVLTLAAALYAAHALRDAARTPGK